VQSGGDGVDGGQKERHQRIIRIKRGQRDKFARNY